MGVLLAGGPSRRYGGEPKGLEEVGGMRIADRILHALAQATERQLVVANDPRAAEWFRGRVVVADERVGLGPLAGIATALAAADGDAVLVVAWDMPFVTAHLLQALRALGGGSVQAVVPSHGPSAQLEPLCAWYAASDLEPCRALLDTGERRASALSAVLPGTRLFTDAELAPFDKPEHLFTSVDSPDDLVRAQRLVEPSPDR